MQDLRNLVLGIGPLPLWAWIVLALLILLGCVFLIWQLWRFGARRASVPEEALEEAPKPSNAFLPQAIRESFVDAHRWLRSVFPGRDYRYAAPVFLMIGESGVGKSTLLRSVSMGRALRETPGSEPINWYFFDRGAIIDSRGDVLGNADEFATDSGPWDTLIQAFQRYRAERPLDGLILVVPVTDFVGPTRLSKEELNARAEGLHRRIGRLQNRTGMQLPIYLILSKCDALEGFSAAADLFSSQSREEALGWSSPYSPDSAFVPTWTGEAVDTIYQKVSEAIVEALAVSAEDRESGQAFLFPGAIRRMEEGLRPFLADLLRVSAYNRSGSLRGIYLTGAPVAGQTHDELAVRDMGYQAGAAVPIYARGLLDRKIFPEYALARPFSLSLLSSNRNVRIAQGVMAAAVILGIAGVWYTDSWLTRTVSNLSNVADGVMRKARSLEETRATGVSPDDQLLQQSTLPLLLALGEADRRNLVSLVVPGSWISPLPGNVDRMLDQAFQVILFESMHDSLVARLDHLQDGVIPASPSSGTPASGTSASGTPTSGTPTSGTQGSTSQSGNGQSGSGQGSTSPPANSQSGATQGASGAGAAGQPATNRPAGTVQGSTPASIRSTQDQFAPYPNFALINGFVNDLQTLARNVSLYNSLQNTDSTYAVSSIVEYLYGLQLTDQFFANVGDSLFDGARGRITPINIDNYQTQARQAAAALTNEFYSDLTDRYGLLDNARQLVRLIDQTGVSREPIASLQILRQTEALALEVRSTVQSGRYDWALGPTSNLGPQYQSMLDRMAATPLLGSQVSDAVQSRGSQVYTGFRNDLLQTVSRSIGPLFVESNGRITISPALQELDERLKGLPTLLAATAASAGFSVVELPSSPPPGSFIVWDIQILDDALDASRRLANLELQSAAGSSMPAGQNAASGVGRIVNREIAGRLVASVAEAATIQRLPYSSGSVGYESLVARRVQNFSQAAVRLDRIIAFFDALGATDYRDQIQRLQAQSAYSILQAASDLLQQTGAYEPRNGNFDWWDGGQGAAFSAYGVSNAAELTGYLGLQRERITYITQNYAEPVLIYLLNLRVNVAGVDVNALTRWTTISQDIAQYQSKVPDNPILQLENYIQGPMATVSSANCQPGVPNLDGSSSGYFQATLRSLSSAFASRCFDMANLQVVEGYNQIANGFNRNLAGQFPFAAQVPGSQGAEASLSAVLRFLNQFNVYMNRGAGDPSRWTSVSQSVSQPALQYLNQMDEVNEVFASGMSGQGSAATFEYDLQVAFRVERQLEVGASQLVEWSLTSGTTKVDQFTAGTRVPWKFGDPITVSFTWALNGQTRPTRGDSAPANMAISDRTANFQFTGNWSLFELVAGQAMSSDLKGPDTGSGGSVLQFDVPIELFTDPSTDSDPLPADQIPKAARLFIEVTAFGSKQQGSPRISMPTFPVAAPTAAVPTASTAPAQPAATAAPASATQAAPTQAATTQGTPTQGTPTQVAPTQAATTPGAQPAAQPQQQSGSGPRPLYPTVPGTTSGTAPAGASDAGTTGSGSSAGGRPPSAMTMYDVWRDVAPATLQEFDPMGTGGTPGDTQGYWGGNAWSRNDWNPGYSNQDDWNRSGMGQVDRYLADRYLGDRYLGGRNQADWDNRPWRNPAAPQGWAPQDWASQGRHFQGWGQADGGSQPYDAERWWPREGVFGPDRGGQGYAGGQGFVPPPYGTDPRHSQQWPSDRPGPSRDSLFRRLFETH